jgi:hypothetical protein
VDLFSCSSFNHRPQAILGSHGYKVHEVYDPVWRHVRVPEPFLALMCPMAEATLALVEGELEPIVLSFSLFNGELFREEESVGSCELLADDN